MQGWPESLRPVADIQDLRGTNKAGNEQLMSHLEGGRLQVETKGSCQQCGSHLPFCNMHATEIHSQSPQQHTA